jgi:DNA modification methylase
MKIKYLTGSANKTKEGYELPTTERTLPFLIRPDNVVRFHTAGHARDNTIKHPAPFYKDLPKYYINILTDENDTILDPFGGIMTTGVACNEVGNRNFIGIELNEKYAEFGKKRIEI